MGDISHTGGNVGIGTDTPLVKLNVWGDSSVNGGANRGTLLVSNATNTRQIQFGINDTSAVGWIEGWVPGTGALNLAIQPSGGRLGIGTTSPSATLDVNGAIAAASLDVSGTLKVGDFGGTTNVMAKANNTIADGLPSVGCVLPMYASFAYATVLPAGTWFVFMTWNEGSSASEDEDLAFILSKVWTVPTGQYLKIKNDSVASTFAASGVFYKISIDSTNATDGTGWTEFKASGTGKNAYDLTLTIGETTTNGENYGAIVLQSNTVLASGSGYAMRIA